MMHALGSFPAFWGVKLANAWICDKKTYHIASFQWIPPPLAGDIRPAPNVLRESIGPGRPIAGVECCLRFSHFRCKTRESEEWIDTRQLFEDFS